MYFSFRENNDATHMITNSINTTTNPILRVKPVKKFTALLSMHSPSHYHIIVNRKYKIIGERDEHSDAWAEVPKLQKNIAARAWHYLIRIVACFMTETRYSFRYQIDGIRC